MPRLFVKGSTQSLMATRAPLTAAPATMCAWYYPTTSNAAGSIVGITESANVSDYIIIGVTAAAKPFLEHGHTGTPADSTHGTSVTNGRWGHILGTWTSDTDRSIYFNGINPVQNTTNPGMTGTLNQMSIGALFGSSAISLGDGVIAHAAIWNVVLNQSEITLLANGTNPQRIRPGSLVMYCAVAGTQSPEPDLMSTTTFTVTGATASTNFPPMFTPSNNYQFARVGDGMSAGEKLR